MSAAEDFAQYQLRFVDDIQHDYEVIRPIVLFAETIAERSRQTGIEPTVVGAKARRFAMEGMLGLVDHRLGNAGRKGHTCSGLRTVPRGLANRALFGPALCANTRPLGPTLCAKGPTLVCEGLANKAMGQHSLRTG